MNEKTIPVLMERLHKIVGELAKRDYLQVNTNKQGKFYKKHRPYSLSQETIKAKDILNLLYKPEITKEDEEQIKGYLLKQRCYNPQWF
jgi:CBS domain containing-hemolysin-like protein